MRTTYTLAVVNGYAIDGCGIRNSGTIGLYDIESAMISRENGALVGKICINNTQRTDRQQKNRIGHGCRHCYSNRKTCQRTRQEAWKAQ
jgi:hypothetical protein